MRDIKKPDLDFWDDKESFTIEELTYLFYDLEPQYNLPHPTQILATMKAIIKDEGIFGIEQKKDMRYVPKRRRFLIPLGKERVKDECGKPVRRTVYSDDVTHFPRQALRQWAIEQQVLHLYDFLQTKEERPLAAPPPGDEEPAQPELPSDSAAISGQIVKNLAEEEVPSASPSPTAGAETSPEDDVITLPHKTK